MRSMEMRAIQRRPMQWDLYQWDLYNGIYVLRSGISVVQRLVKPIISIISQTRNDQLLALGLAVEGSRLALRKGSCTLGPEAGSWVPKGDPTFSFPRQLFGYKVIPRYTLSSLLNKMNLDLSPLFFPAPSMLLIWSGISTYKDRSSAFSYLLALADHKILPSPSPICYRTWLSDSPLNSAWGYHYPDHDWISVGKTITANHALCSRSVECPCLMFLKE